MYKDGDTCERVITHGEMIAITPNETDFYCNEATGKIHIQCREGPPLEYFGSMPGIQHTTWLLQTEAMYAPGIFLTPHELYRRTKHESFLSRPNVSAYLKRIRRAFGESGKMPWYFWTRRMPDFAVCWHADRSWRIIERLVEPHEPVPGEDAKSDH
jgi:hypothetical protein